MENEELVEEIRAGINVKDNLGILYEQNRGFIANIARKYSAMSEMDDLMQEGFIGLYKAVEGYNPDRGALFITYAKHWIEQDIQRYIDNCGASNRIPVWRKDRIRKYNRIVKQYTSENGEQPDDATLCDLLETDKDTLDQIREDLYMENPTSLNSIVSQNGTEDTELMDSVADESEDFSDVLEELQNEQLKAIIWPTVDALGPDKSTVVRGIYRDNRELRDLGRELGISHQGVAKRRDKALKDLRQNEELQTFLDDDIRSMGLRGNGAHSFNTTWTSSTERAAMKL